MNNIFENNQVVENNNGVALENDTVQTNNEVVETAVTNTVSDNSAVGSLLDEVQQAPVAVAETKEENVETKQEDDLRVGQTSMFDLFSDLQDPIVRNASTKSPTSNGSVGQSKVVKAKAKKSSKSTYVAPKPTRVHELGDPFEFDMNTVVRYEGRVILLTGMFSEDEILKGMPNTEALNEYEEKLKKMAEDAENKAAAEAESETSDTYDEDSEEEIDEEEASAKKEVVPALEKPSELRPINGEDICKRLAEQEYTELMEQEIQVQMYFNKTTNTLKPIPAMGKKGCGVRG